MGDAGGRFVFSRSTSYRPVWVTGEGMFAVEHLSDIRGDCDADGRFDRSNAYAWARLLSSSDDEVRIGWRYAPGVSRTAPSDFVYEVYSIRADGTVRREHRAGTETITAWRDAGMVTVQSIALAPDGLTVTDETQPVATLEVTVPAASAIVEPAVPPTAH